MDHFMSDIKNGKWDNVLQNISTLKVPVTKLFDLYEQVPFFIHSFISSNLFDSVHSLFIDDDADRARID